MSTTDIGLISGIQRNSCKSSRKGYQPQEKNGQGIGTGNVQKRKPQRLLNKSSIRTQQQAEIRK